MGTFNGSVLFVLIWWTVLFAVLPLGTQPVAEPDHATGWRGAPAKPQIARKLIITTMVTGLIWLACLGIIESGLISFRHGFFALPEY